MPDQSTTVIGFDFGTYWIGVAVGQTLTRQATPLPALRYNDWKAIERLLDEWRPQQLVVGMPLSMDGEDQEMTPRTKRFARKSCQRTQHGRAAVYCQSDAQGANSYSGSGKRSGAC